MWEIWCEKDVIHHDRMEKIRIFILFIYQVANVSYNGIYLFFFPMGLRRDSLGLYDQPDAETST